MICSLKLVLPEVAHRMACRGPYSICWGCSGLRRLERAKGVCRLMKGCAVAAAAAAVPARYPSLLLAMRGD